MVPSRPTSPDVVRNLLVGALAGLLLGVGFALLRHNLDTRVREVRDIEGVSDRPVLAKLPARKNPSRQTLFIDTDPFGPHAEAVRRLRTNLMFVDVTTRQHSFVITSASPAEGKTTTAINLAMAMADAGTRVLLVDADLRNPSVATTMGMEGAVGLTTVLLGRAGLEDMAQQWGSSELWVLPAGEIPPNPSELLGSEAMRDLFAEMMNTYEFVLFDTPPVLPVTDALVVEKLTGGTLMVVAANRTRKRHLVEALRLLETTNTKVAGFALNFASSEAATYYGYYRAAEDAKRGSRRGRKKTRRDQAEELDRQGGIRAREAMGEKATLTEGLDEVRR